MLPELPILFDEQKHSYCWVPTSEWMIWSVSEVVKPLSPEQREWLEKNSHYAERGTAIHKTLEEFLSGQQLTDLETYSEWTDRLIHHNWWDDIEILALEHRLADPKRSIGGSFDGLIKKNGKTCLFDLKTKQAEASIFGSEKQADAARFGASESARASIESATLGADAERYSAEQAAGAQRDVASTQAGSARDVASTQAQSARDVATTQAEASKFSASTAADANKYGADRSVDVSRINTEGTIANTKETGTQTRQTMDNEYRLKAKDRANMHNYARSTARAM